MPVRSDEVALLGSVLDRIDGDAKLGREAGHALRRACKLLLRVALSREPGAARLVADQLPILVDEVDRVATLSKKRDQRGPARMLGRDIESTVRRWRDRNSRAEAAAKARWLHRWVWDGIRRAWDAVEAEFDATRVRKNDRSKASFLAVRDAARDRFRWVAEDEARQFQSQEPHHVVVDGDPLRDQLLAAAGLDIDDILLALYFPARRANAEAGLDDDDLKRFDAVVDQLDDGSSGFGPIAATHVILSRIVFKSANTVEKKERSAKRSGFLPPVGGSELGTPDDPWRSERRPRVGSLRGRRSAERRPDDD